MESALIYMIKITTLLQRSDGRSAAAALKQASIAGSVVENFEAFHYTKSTSGRWCVRLAQWVSRHWCHCLLSATGHPQCTAQKFLVTSALTEVLRGKFMTQICFA